MVCNEMACELFSFTSAELVGCQLSDLLTLKSKEPTAITENLVDDSGEVIEIAGQVVCIIYITNIHSFHRHCCIEVTFLYCATF